MKKTVLLLLVLLMLFTYVPVQAVSMDKVINVPIVGMGDNTLLSYFSNMNQDPAPVLEKLFLSANYTIDIAVYSLTNPRVIRAIDNAKLSGKRVRIITDRTQSGFKYDKIALQMLFLDGIPIKVNSHPGEMNYKMAVIDNKVVAIGSYDYTLDSSQTSDDVLVLINNKEFAKQCTESFNQMWESDKFKGLYE